MIGLIGRFLLFLLSLLIGSGLFAWIGKMVGWQEIKNAFSILTGWQVIVIFGFTLAIMLVSNWRWKEILKGEGIKISFRSLLSPYLAGFGILYLAPILIWGGELFRVYTLKERNLIPWPKAMASVIIDRILEWTFNLAAIFLGISFFIYKIGLPSSKLLIIFGSIFSILVLAVFFFYFKTFKKESITKTIGKIFIKKLDKQPLDTEKEIFDFFKFKNKSIYKAILLSFLRIILVYFRTWILIFFLGGNIGWILTLVIFGFSYLAVMIPIPASLGSHEVIQTFVFKSLGLEISFATVFTMLIRTTEIIFALLGIIILLQIWVGLLKNILLGKAEKLIIKH